MKKLAIVFDSFTGVSKKELNKMGFYIVPQTSIINGEVILDGVDGTLSKYVSLIKKSDEFKSSMPAIGRVVEKFEELQKKAEHIIYIPMNKGMSSTYSTGAAAAKEFKNVHVIDNKFSGHAGIYYAKKAMEMIKKDPIAKVVKMLKKASDDSHTWIIPKTVDQLIKSGRLTGAKKVILQKGKLIPKLYLTDDGITTKAVGRNFAKLISSSVEKTLKDISKPSDYIWEVIYAGDKTTQKLATEIIAEQGVKEKVQYAEASVTVTCYNGIGAIGINVYKK